MMLHMVAFDVFGITGAHWKMMLGKMGQIIYQVTRNETRHQRCNPFGRMEQNSQDQVKKPQENSRKWDADREGHHQARLHLGLGMVDAVEQEEDPFLAWCGRVMVE